MQSMGVKKERKKKEREKEKTLELVEEETDEK